jgi:hypothetical protein
VNRTGWRDSSFLLAIAIAWFVGVAMGWVTSPDAPAGDPRLEEIEFVGQCVDAGGETWTDGLGRLHCRSTTPFESEVQ